MDLVSLLTSTTSKGNPNAWDISKAYYDAGADAWDISKAFYSSVNFSFASQETNSAGMFFKPDGTKMYICGTINDAINEYDLSTPWLVSSATYVQNFSVSAEDTVPFGIFFKPDGTKLYVVGSTGDDVNEYSLSTAWDVSSASYVQNFSVATEDTTPTGIFFKDDGTKMYILGDAGNDVNEYNLSSAWDISTASYLQNFSVGTEEASPYGLFFKPDGEFMYVVGTGGDDVNEYALSTPWDISTASYVRVFSVQAQEPSVTSVFFKPDGSAFYIAGASNERVYQYTIGGFYVGVEAGAPHGLFFKPDGTKMYVLDDGGNDVNEYDLSTAWDITTASYLQNFSVSSQETTPTGIFFKPDGTEMYITGQATADAVYQYSLSSAWDISTASYLQSKTNFQETSMEGLFFKADGMVLYTVGVSLDQVLAFNLTSAWDISTASLNSDSSFSLSAQTSVPNGLFFKPDGTKMYVCGDDANDSVYEYSLSTAWDITSSSFVQSFLIQGQESAIQSVFWKDDGTQFFIIGTTNDRVLSYLISPE